MNRFLSVIASVALVTLVPAIPLLAECPLTRTRESTFPLSNTAYINYRTVGEGRNVVIALHGFGASLDTWKEVEPELASRYRVFMPDLPGFGLSAKPKAFLYSISEQATSIAAFVEFVYRQTDAQTIALIGHSYGGLVSMAALLLLKDRHEVPVNRLVLVDAPAFPEAMRFPFYINVLRVPILNRLALNLLPPQDLAHIVLKNLIFNRALLTPECICRYGQFLSLSGAHRSLIRTAGQLNRVAEIEEFTRRISEINIPTLIIWGEHDRLIPPAQAGLIHDAIATSEEAPFLEAGHIPQQELPHDTAELIKHFLDQ